MKLTVRNSAFMAGGLLVALTAMVIFPAQAQVYKCTASNGSTVYQESPCASAGSKLHAPDPSPGMNRGSDKSKSTESTKKAMNEAFQSRMDKGDFEGALAFASDDRQKSQARKKLHEKEVKCEKLAIKVKSAKTKTAINAAESDYRLSCR